MAEGIRYREIYEALRGEITGGKYASSRVFPSSTALARRFATTRFTIRQALDKLIRDGFLSSHKGSGTFVTRQGATRKIGLMVPGVAYSEFFPPIVSELSRLAQKNAYTLIFGDVPSRSPVRRVEQAKAFARELVREQVAGVIYQPLEFISGADAYNGEIVSVLAAARIPVVLIDSDIVAPPARSAFDFVGINNFEAGRRLAQHLTDAGARRICLYAGGSPVESVRGRFAGVEYVTDRLGVTLDRKLLVAEPSDLKAITAFLRRQKPDAFVCGNDAYAAELRQAFARLGCRVPDDVLLAGFDDVRHAVYMSPQLTTIHQPCEAIAQAAFRALTARIAEPDLPPREILLSAPLVVRESTQRKTTTISQQKRTKGTKK